MDKFIFINMCHPVYIRLTCSWSAFGCCLRLSFLDAISCSTVTLGSALPWFQFQFSFYGTHVTSLFPQRFFWQKNKKQQKKNLLSKIHLKMISYRCPQCSYVHWLALGACIFSHNRELFYTSHLAFSSMTVAHIPWGPCKLAKSSMKACQ